MPPLVSIVIDNFNYARYLPAAIDSALGQDHTPLEVVVVDDGSTDESREIIARYDGEVRAVLKQNGGQASAFNAGFFASTGEIVMFLDADDYLELTAASRVLRAWSESCSKVQFRLSLVDEAGRRRGADPPMSVPMPNGDVAPQLLGTGRYTTPVTAGNAYRRSVLEQIMPMPEDRFRQGADGFINAVCPFYGDVISIEDELGSYRRHGSYSGFSRTREVTPGSIRWLIEHDLQREHVIRLTAQSQGRAVPDDLLLRDSSHVLNRLASLRLDPAGHPFGRDTRLELVRAGVSATLRDSGRPVADKALDLAIVLAVGLPPAPLARLVIAWALSNGPRSRWLKFAARVARGSQRHGAAG